MGSWPSGRKLDLSAVTQPSLPHSLEASLPHSLSPSLTLSVPPSLTHSLPLSLSPSLPSFRLQTSVDYTYTAQFLAWVGYPLLGRGPLASALTGMTSLSSSFAPNMHFIFPLSPSPFCLSPHSHPFQR